MKILRRHAVFSPDRRYRYALWRDWHVNPAKVCCFVLLNPSTADEEFDDPTVRRCISFAETWGDDMLIVLNLFALRSTDPAALRVDSDPIGPNNDAWLDAVGGANRIVLAWGAHGCIQGRGNIVRDRLRTKDLQLWQFGMTANGQPKHPLYLPSGSQLVPA